jgi:hypothetical protein
MDLAKKYENRHASVYVDFPYMYEFLELPNLIVSKIKVLYDL